MINTRQSFTFDDLLLVPKYSEVDSRKLVNTSVDLGKGVKLDIPIVSANMKTVTETAMANVISALGGLALLHRFNSVEENLQMYQDCLFKDHVGCSIGVGDDEKNRADVLANGSPFSWSNVFGT